MAQDEYVLGLLAIISGLAITEWMTSFHQLIVARRRVKKDWLAIMAAVFIAYAIAFSWWIGWRSFHNYVGPIRFRDFVVALIQAAAVYMSAKAVLPQVDPQREETIDMRANYMNVAREVWLGMFVASALIIPFDLLTLWNEGTIFPEGGLVTGLPGALAYSGVFMMLAISRSRRVHAVLLPLVFSAALVVSMSASL